MKAGGQASAPLCIILGTSEGLELFSTGSF